MFFLRRHTSALCLLAATLLVALLALAPVCALADEAEGDGAKVIGEVETAVSMYFPAGPPQGGEESSDPASDGKTPLFETSDPKAQTKGVVGAVSGSQAVVAEQTPLEEKDDKTTAKTDVGLVAAGSSEVPTSWALATLNPVTWPTALASMLMAALAAALMGVAARQKD